MMLKWLGGEEVVRLRKRIKLNYLGQGSTA